MIASNHKEFIAAWPVALCLFVLSFLSSCQKDDNGPSNPTFECRIKKISVDTTRYSLYQFDKKDNLQQISSFTNGKEDRVFSYEYNSQGQVSQITIKEKYLNFQQELIESISTIFTFEYDPLGQIAKYRRFYPKEPNSSFNAETVFEYDTEGNRTRIVTTFVNDPKTHIDTYTYENGNCIKSVSSSPELNYEGITEHTFDLSKENKQRKFNQLFDFKHLTGPTPNKNMVVKDTFSNNQNASLNGTTNYAYEYNDRGYVIKQSIDFDGNPNNGANTIVRFEYNCQKG